MKYATAIRGEYYYIVCPTCGADIYINLDDLQSEHIVGMKLDCSECKQPITIEED